MSRISKTVLEKYRDVADRYARDNARTEYVLEEVVCWAMENHLLEFSEDDEHAFHLDRLSESLRSDSAKDRNGRTVRLRHCLEVKDTGDDGKPRQRTLWAHIDDASDDFLFQSLDQRHKRIKADVVSLRADIDYINARRARRGLQLIQMNFDFNAPEEPDPCPT